MTNWEAWIKEREDDVIWKKFAVCDSYGMDCKGCPLNEVDEEGIVFYDCSDTKDFKRWLEAEVKK